MGNGDFLSDNDDDNNDYNKDHHFNKDDHANDKYLKNIYPPPLVLAIGVIIHPLQEVQWSSYLGLFILINDIQGKIVSSIIFSFLQ